MKKFISLIAIILLVCAFTINKTFNVPKIWVSKYMKDLMLPLADSTIKIKHLPDSLYYGLEEMTIYKTYPFYLPGTEPEGYYEELLQKEPEIVFKSAGLNTKHEWIKMGEIIYDYPQVINSFPVGDTMISRLIREQILAENTPMTKDGQIPFNSLVIREKGKIEIGSMSCSNCHTRVMSGGQIFKGGQGNNPFDLNFGNSVAQNLFDPNVPDSIKQIGKNRMIASLFGAPWITSGLQKKSRELTHEEVVKSLTNTFGGVMHRHGTALGSPTSIPDLYNIKDRKYLDHTGLMQHRSIEDLMLYATLNQQADRYDKYNNQVVMLPWPSEGGPSLVRYSEEQLYALAEFLYSLEAPKNPEKADSQILKKGETVFIEQGCVTCHTPPLYTNNKLTPVDGFQIPKHHFELYDIFNVSVETDPALALESRRGTGYYKIPSLIGVWNRDALLHNGNVRSLEELFDQARLKEDYVPNGYRPGWTETYAIKGHPFGLEISDDEKVALITFLRSL